MLNLTQPPVLPTSDAVAVDILRRIFRDRATSYKFLFLLSLLDLLQARGYGGWENISLRRIAVEMLSHAYLPYKNDLILAHKRRERSGQIFELMDVSKQLADLDHVRREVNLKYNESLGDILEYVPYRLIRPFFQEELRGAPDAEVNSRIVDLAGAYFEQRKPLYRFDPERQAIDVCEEWGLYLRNEYPAVRAWVCSEWESYISELNTNIKDLPSKLFWPTPKSAVQRTRETLHTDAMPVPYTAAQQSVAKTVDEATETTSAMLAAAEVFNGIDPRRGEATLLQASSRMFARLRELPKPCSLCEIQCTDGDITWLNMWLSAMGQSTLYRWLVQSSYDRPKELSGVSRRQALGLLLFLFCSEIARRQGKEGEVWSPIKNRLPEHHADILFRDTAPNSLFLDSLVDAANRFELRNVFGQPGLQQYYASIYLQFGITDRGLDQIPLWIDSNQPSEAVKHLLSSNRLTASSSFAKAWNMLVELRRRKLPPPDLKQALISTSWFSPTCVDAVIKAVLSRPRVSASDLCDASDGFLCDPRLRWSGTDQPVFECTITGLNSFLLPDDEYFLFCGNEQLGRVLRQEDQFHSLAPIRLPVDQPSPIVELKSHRGEVVASCSLDLWSEDEDVECFELPSGKRCDAWVDRLEKSASYAILCEMDLQPNLPEIRWLSFPSAGKRLWLVPPDVLKKWQLFLEGELYWQPAIHSNGSTIPGSDSFSITTLDSSTVNLEDCINLVVLGLPHNVRIVKATAGGKKLQFQKFGKQWISTDLSVSEVIKLNGLRASLLLESGEQRGRVSRIVSANIIGMMEWRGKAWHKIDCETTLTTCKAKENSFRVFLPKALSSNDVPVALFEGSQYCRPIRTRKEPIGTLAGYGAPLYACHAYTPGDIKSQYVLASQVVDYGVISSCEFGNRTVTIKLTRPIEPTERHHVILWDYRSEPHRIEYQQIRSDDLGIWEICPPDDFTPKSAAIAYNGARLGSYFSDLKACVRQSVETLGPAESAALQRWAHFPILCKDVAVLVCQAACRHPAEYLAAWIDGDGLPPDLLLTEDEESWLTVVLEVFRNWKPDSAEQATRIVNTLSQRGGYQAALAKLVRVSPELLARIGRPLRRTPVFREIGPPAKLLAAQLLRLDRECPVSDMTNAAKRLITESAEILGIADNVLANLARSYCDAALDGTSISDGIRHNICASMRVPGFRSYISSTMLLSLTQQI